MKISQIPLVGLREALLQMPAGARCLDDPPLTKQAGQVSGSSNLVEIGEIVSGAVRGRIAEDQITVSAFSGLAIQDIAMAAWILKRS